MPERVLTKEAPTNNPLFPSIEKFLSQERTRLESKRGAQVEKAKTPEDIPFEGFTKDEEKMLKKQLIAINSILPMEKVSLVNYGLNKQGEENTMATYHPADERITYKKNIKKLPPVAQLETGVHETSHADSPYNPDNDDVYGSKEAREKVASYVDAVAMQTLITNTHLSTYHENLHKDLAEKQQLYSQGQITKDKLMESVIRFKEETFAIHLAQRIVNPNHVKEIENSQHDRLSKLQAQGREVPKPVSLMTKTSGEQLELSGIDHAIMIMKPEIRTYNELEKRANVIRKTGREPVLMEAA